jgi:hypothetical protein
LNSLYLSINIDTGLIKEALGLFKLNKNKINFDDFKKIYNYINEKLDNQNDFKNEEVSSPQVSSKSSKNLKEKDGSHFGFFSFLKSKSSSQK